MSDFRKINERIVSSAQNQWEIILSLVVVEQFGERRKDDRMALWRIFEGGFKAANLGGRSGGSVAPRHLDIGRGVLHARIKDRPWRFRQEFPMRWAESTKVRRASAVLGTVGFRSNSASSDRPRAHSSRIGPPSGVYIVQDG